MNPLDLIRQFDSNSLRPTLVEIRNFDGSVTVMNKFGGELQTKVGSRSEPNFSQYGFIVNPSPDLHIGRVNLGSYKILFGSLDVAKDLSLLKENEVTHIANLVSNYFPNLFPESFVYLSLVLYDDLEFRLSESVRQFCDFMRRVRLADGTCFVHCDAGICRAPAIVMAHLIHVEEFSYKQAYSIVNNARNIMLNFNFKSQLMAMSDF